MYSILPVFRINSDFKSLKHILQEVLTLYRSNNEYDEKKEIGNLNASNSDTLTRSQSLNKKLY